MKNAPSSRSAIPNSQFPIPNSPKQIFLIGMPGAGKTFWGDKIAREHALEFIDLDIFVAQQENASIPAMFAQYGESGFREREHRRFKKLIGNITVHTVIACGGGTPCYHENIQLMKAAGIVIYLQADIPYLLDNINNSGEIRPLLRGRPDVKGYLEELLQRRKIFYEQAHYILPAKNISLITFDKILTSCIDRH